MITTVLILINLLAFALCGYLWKQSKDNAKNLEDTRELAREYDRKWEDELLKTSHLKSQLARASLRKQPNLHPSIMENSDYYVCETTATEELKALVPNYTLLAKDVPKHIVRLILTNSRVKEAMIRALKQPEEFKNS
jgi:hypothetical protein